MSRSASVAAEALGLAPARARSARAARRAVDPCPGARRRHAGRRRACPRPVTLPGPPPTLTADAAHDAGAYGPAGVGRRPGLRRAQPARPVLRRHRGRVGRGGPPGARPRDQPDRHRAGLRHRVDRGEGAARAGATRWCCPPRRCRCTRTARSSRSASAGRWRRASSGCAPITSTCSSCTACRCATSTTPARCSCPSCSPCKDDGLIRHLAASEAFASDNGHDVARPEPRRRRRLVRRADGRAQPVQPVGARPRVPGHRGARHRRARDVRGAQVPGLAGGRAPGRRRPDRARASSIPAPSTPTTRSGSCSPTTAPRRFAEAAYRFARHEPGCHVVLTGTGSVDHLAENVAAINGPPLPLEHQKRLQELFGHIDCVTGD